MESGLAWVPMWGGWDVSFPNSPMIWWSQPLAVAAFIPRSSWRPPAALARCWLIRSVNDGGKKNKQKKHGDASREEPFCNKPLCDSPRWQSNTSPPELKLRQSFQVVIFNEDAWSSHPSGCRCTLIAMLRQESRTWRGGGGCLACVHTYMHPFGKHKHPIKPSGSLMTAVNGPLSSF